MKSLTIGTQEARIMQAEGIGIDMIQRFIAYADVKASSLVTYQKSLRRFVIWMQAEGIARPTRDDIVAFKAAMLETCKPATVHNYLAAVKVFFRWTGEQGLYPNVAEHVKKPQVDASVYKKDFLTKQQCRDMLATFDRETLKGKRDYAITVLCLTTGLRTVEIVRADAGDLRAVADEQAEDIYTALFLRGKGRDDKSEWVKIVPEAEAAIRDYWAARGNVRKEDPLFTSVSNRDQGSRMTTRSISRIAKDALVAAGMDDARHTAHSLRHTAGTLAKLGGSSWQEVQQMLRHHEISTTMRYAHTLERASNQSEERIAKAIFA